jgi:hypothetical protein
VGIKAWIWTDGGLDLMVPGQVERIGYVDIKASGRFGRLGAWAADLVDVPSKS